MTKYGTGFEMLITKDITSLNHDEVNGLDLGDKVQYGDEIYLVGKKDDSVCLLIHTAIDSVKQVSYKRGEDKAWAYDDTTTTELGGGGGTKLYQHDITFVFQGDDFELSLISLEKNELTISTLTKGLVSIIEGKNIADTSVLDGLFKIMYDKPNQMIYFHGIMMGTTTLVQISADYTTDFSSFSDTVIEL